MAFFSLWALGFLICTLSVIYLWKQIAALRTCNAFRKHFAKTHREVTRQIFDQGWMWLDIILVFFVLSFASQSQLFAAGEGFAPEILTFLGIALYCASRAVACHNEGQILFYPQGFVWKTHEIPWRAIRTMKQDGNRYEIATRSETILISRSQYHAVCEKKDSLKGKQTQH